MFLEAEGAVMLFSIPHTPSHVLDTMQLAVLGQDRMAELDGVPEAIPHVTDGEAEPGRWADLLKVIAEWPGI